MLEIIDGQQRLATLSMILAALRNKLMSLGTADSGASSASNKLHEYILRTDLLGHPKGAALTLGKYDQDGFRRYVQLRPGEQSHLGVDANLPQIKPGRPPINRIKEAFKHIIELVDKYIADLPPEKQRDRLANLADYLLEKVTHITIEVTEDVDAFALFETVNYRGLDLSVADLLKNHLFSLATNDSQIEELTALWSTFVNSLEDHQITRFLRYFWLSRYEHVTDKALYSRIKDHIRSESITPIDFLNLLNDQASIFASLVAPKDGDPCALELRDLLSMRMTQGIPFLMAAKEELDEKYFKHAVLIVETLSIRNTLVGKRNTNELDRGFGQWARQLRQGENSTSEIVAAAKSLCINDREFEEGFKELSELTSPQARYLLRKIEWFRDKETQIASTGVDIEHIVPQSLNPSWIGYMGGSDEEVQEASQKLGNLALLNERLNKQAATKPFKEKRDSFYKKSKIGITNSLANYEDWTYETISERQAEFADKAKKIWRL